MTSRNVNVQRRMERTMLCADGCGNVGRQFTLTGVTLNQNDFVSKTKDNNMQKMARNSDQIQQKRKSQNKFALLL